MVASIQQHEESAIISVGSKKRHENNKSILLERKTTKARQTRLTTKKPKLTRKKITGGRPGKRVAMQLVKMSRALSNLNLSALTG